MVERLAVKTSHYCGLGAGSIHFRAIARRGVYLCRRSSTTDGRCIRLWGVSTPEITYIVLGGPLNCAQSVGLVEVNGIFAFA